MDSLTKTLLKRLRVRVGCVDENVHCTFYFSFVFCSFWAFPQLHRFGSTLGNVANLFSSNVKRVASFLFLIIKDPKIPKFKHPTFEFQMRNWRQIELHCHLIARHTQSGQQVDAATSTVRQQIRPQVVNWISEFGSHLALTCFLCWIINQFTRYENISSQT